jgi:hypothetical protein
MRAIASSGCSNDEACGLVTSYAARRFDLLSNGGTKVRAEYWQRNLMLPYWECPGARKWSAKMTSGNGAPKATMEDAKISFGK